LNCVNLPTASLLKDRADCKQTFPLHNPLDLDAMGSEQLRGLRETLLRKQATTFSTILQTHNPDSLPIEWELIFTKVDKENEILKYQPRCTKFGQSVPTGKKSLHIPEWSLSLFVNEDFRMAYKIASNAVKEIESDLTALPVCH